MSAEVLHSDEPMPLCAGDRVAGFEIIRRMGTGGSADVYEAEHLELGRRVALKIVRVRDDASVETLARFRREARTAGRLRHPHIADVFDVGHTDAGDPYLVMELLDGETLDAVTARGPMPLCAALEIACELSDALAFVHAHGVVHRDVKPHNLVLHRGDTGHTVVKLLDFGIAKPPEAARERMITRTGLIVGTPHYMPPELLLGGEATPAQDVYAAGVVLFECLTGRPPFDANSIGAVISAVLTGEVPTVVSFQPSAPEAVSALVAKAIARRPEDRFPTADALRDALVELARELGVPLGAAALAQPNDAPARSSGVHALAATGQQLASPTPVASPRVIAARHAWRRRAATLAAAAAVALLTSAAGAGLAYVTTDHVAPTSPTTGTQRPTLPAIGAAGRSPPPAAVGLPDGASPPAVAPHDAVARRLTSPPPDATVSAASRDAARALVRDALSAYVASEWPRAQALYRAALRRDPSNADAWRGLAGVSTHMGQPSEARRAYRRYLELAPDAPDARAVRRAMQALP